MAAKNQNRVAAGKKAWANRSTASKKRSYTKKSGGRRRKPIQRGIGGRIGAFMVGAVPSGLSGVEVASAAMAKHKAWDLNALSAVTYGLYRFVNNLGNGFVGVIPFDKAEMTNKAGQSSMQNVGSGLPKGSLLVTTGVGFFMMAEDWLASKLSGGRPVKVIGTNYNAIGGS